MTAVWTIALYGLREAVRRKVFVVVCLLSVAFLVLYWLGTRYAFHDVAIPSFCFVELFFGARQFRHVFLGQPMARVGPVSAFIMAASFFVISASQIEHSSLQLDPRVMTHLFCS